MTTERSAVFDDIQVDHVEFFVADSDSAAKHYTRGYGFSTYGAARSSIGSAETRSVAVGRNNIRLVLSQVISGEHRAAGYVRRHGDGVADIAMTVPDATAAYDVAVARGARPIATPVERDGVTVASVGGFGDVVHTLVQRADGLDVRALPGLTPTGHARLSRHETEALFEDIDHFAVCLQTGELDTTVAFYETVFGFDMVFAERIVVGRQAMNSKVVQSQSGSVVLTLIEPDPVAEPGQIDEFLANHGGSGVQHVAFRTSDIVDAVSRIRAAGVEFLRTPDSYYTLLPQRLELTQHTVDELRDLMVLVDEDHDGQLYQIFAKSVHPRNTFFTEIIERFGARSFGSGNIKALYEAVELQRGEARHRAA